LHINTRGKFAIQGPYRSKIPFSFIVIASFARKLLKNPLSPYNHSFKIPLQQFRKCRVVMALHFRRHQIMENLGVQQLSTSTVIDKTGEIIGNNFGISIRSRQVRELCSFIPQTLIEPVLSSRLRRVGCRGYHADHPWRCRPRPESRMPTE